MVRPDILVIDEALSLGDMAFQKKCVQRMNEFREQRKTMVFCSHSMFHVQDVDDRPNGATHDRHNGATF